MPKDEFANLSLVEQQAIRKLRAESEKAQAATYPLRPLEQISDAEKIAGFDNLYEQALKVWAKHRDEGYYSDDESQWAFESMMAFLINPEYPTPGAAATRENYHISSRAFWGAFRKLGQGAV